MIIYPAIDLKDGNCVRLFQGNMEKNTIFSNSPSGQISEFIEAGFTHIHIVDLNGAFAGNSVNNNAIKSIIKERDRLNKNVKLQLGGGIRNIDSVRYWLQEGIDRVIIGTALIKDPEFVRIACMEFPNQILFGIDARKGIVAINGWGEEAKIKAIDLIKNFSDLEDKVAGIIYTDIEKDGMMTGINIDETINIAENTKIKVIASGGLSSKDDLVALKNKMEEKVSGVIIGRAFYEKKLGYKEALDFQFNY